MTPTAFRLLHGYLRRSAWLYSGVGLAQFLVTDFYWEEGFLRVSVPTSLLGLWGIAAAINKSNLVWRSLPLARRDASIFRWWAIAGAPGLWLTLCDSIAWASQRTSAGVSAPPVAALLQDILVGWATVGAIAVLPSLRRFFRGPVAARVIAAFTALYALWLLYGLPFSSKWSAMSIATTAIGWGFLLLSAIEAARGKLWRWPDVAANGTRRARQSSKWSMEPRFGVGVILIPMLRQTLLFAVAASGGVVLLYQLFPGAGVWLFWSYFLTISTTGFLQTYQVRSAIQILRVLPFSANQLAARLQFLAALPGLVTLALALLVNITVLHLKLDPLEFATFALIAVAAQVLPIQEPRVRMSAAFLKWSRLFQRIFMPFYVGIIVLRYAGVWAFWWFKLPIIVSAMVLCWVGYYTLVRQLRAGVQPAGNESAFSAT